MQISPRLLPLAGGACALVLALAGCAGAVQTPPASAAATSAMAGNWSIQASTAPASGSQIAALSGGVTAQGSLVTAVLHSVPVASQTASALCYAPSKLITATGTLKADNTVVLTGAFDTSQLTIDGTWNPTTKTLDKATFAITGSCAVAAQPASAVHYDNINGTYTGNFNSAQGVTIPVSATLTQTTSPDANGTYQLQGNATFPSGDPCVSSPVVTTSTVTGSNFSATYTDPNSGATIVATGTFNQAATVLTISNYTLTGTGGCSDNGNGVLTENGTVQ